MNEQGKKGLAAGAALILGFILWTVLIMKVDVKPLGVNGTDIGFSAVNTWFFELTGMRESSSSRTISTSGRLSVMSRRVLAIWPGNHCMVCDGIARSFPA